MSKITEQHRATATKIVSEVMNVPPEQARHNERARVDRVAKILAEETIQKQNKPPGLVLNSPE